MHPVLRRTVVVAGAGAGVGQMAARAAMLLGAERVIYNDDTGGLFFDQDGAGGATKVQFAELDAGWR